LEDLLVLIIEDDPEIQALIDEALCNGGYEPAIAASGEEAITLLQGGKIKYRALVTDINLAGRTDGWKVARAARAIDPTFPVVYMSGGAADQWAVQGVPNSILLAKPFAPAQLVISPGPGRPADAGVSIEIIRRLAPTTPTLGVCLGHQALVHAFGGVVGPAKRLMHGKSSPVSHDGKGIFTGLPQDFEAGRYHSLAALPPVPDVLEVTAYDADGEIMAVRHRELAHLHGLQFHPESILTPDGDTIARRFLALAEPA